MAADGAAPRISASCSRRRRRLLAQIDALVEFAARLEIGRCGFGARSGRSARRRPASSAACWRRSALTSVDRSAATSAGAHPGRRRQRRQPRSAVAPPRARRPSGRRAADGGRAALGAHRRERVRPRPARPHDAGHERLRGAEPAQGRRRAYQHIPVIMISALDEIDSVVRCIEAGAEDYLPKPFNPVLLRARIGASLEKKRLRDREKRLPRGAPGARRQSPRRCSSTSCPRRSSSACIKPARHDRRPLRRGHRAVRRHRRLHAASPSQMSPADRSICSTAIFSAFDAPVERIGRREDQDHRRRLHGRRRPARAARRPRRAPRRHGARDARGGRSNRERQHRRAICRSASACTPAPSSPASSAPTNSSTTSPGR